jgi:drug/metabolite transporter (DMT)-like permease
LSDGAALSSGADRRRQVTLATAALASVTVVWGSTFLIVQNSVDQLPVMDFLFTRFFIAAAVMLIVRPRCIAQLSPLARRHGIGLGCVLGLGYILQTFGLQHTPAAVSGFITGMFVVFTPLISWLLLGKTIDRAAWGGVALATVGLGLLALHGFSLGLGELLTLACAVAYAVHIVGLGEWSTAQDAYGLAALQLLTVTVISLVGAIPHGITLPNTGRLWAATLFMAIAATALAFMVQTWAQAHLAPTRAAIVMTLEPVFAGIFAVTFGHESFTARAVLGAGCVLAAMYLVELGPRHARDAAVGRLEA